MLWATLARRATLGINDLWKGKIGGGRRRRQNPSGRNGTRGRRWQ